MEASTIDSLPPPYTPATCATESQSEECEALLSVVQKEMYRQRSIVNSDPRHAERIKNFVLFALAIDYGVATGISLTQLDYTHFAKMNTQLDDLKCLSTHPTSNSTKHRREAIIAWFSEHLHQPCMTLGLPVEFVIEIIARFFYFTTPQAAYKSSVQLIAYYHGLSRLAQKLYFDRHIIIPRIISATQIEIREKMLRQLELVSKQYFESVDGVYSSLDTRNIRANFRITYELKRKDQPPQRVGWRVCIRTYASKVRSKLFERSLEEQVLKKRGVEGPRADRLRSAPLTKLEMPKPTEQSWVTEIGLTVLPCTFMF